MSSPVYSLPPTTSPGLRLASGLVVALVLLLVGGSLGAVFWRAEALGGLALADLRAIRFTLMQAALSAIISCLLAIPLARALSRRRFAGRRLMITGLGAPFLLPVIVAVFGLLALFGRSGLVNQALGWLGLPSVNIYGLQGILIAHVFLNLPLATRMLLQGWAQIPAETFRLAASLSLSDRQVFHTIERPMLKAHLPGALLAVFLLCLTSFAVVLALGGGPRAITIELAIYEAFRLEFDLARAALLGLVQVGLGLAAVILALLVPQPSPGQGLDRVTERWDGAGVRRFLDALILLAGVLFIAAPMLIVLIRGIAALAELPAGLWQPALRTLIVAGAATFLVLLMALPLALRIAAKDQRAGAKVTEIIGTATIAASPLVLGTGLFLLLNPVIDPVRLALPATALINAMMALPFALRVLIPAACEIEARFGRLSDSLDLPLSARLRHVILPRLRQPLGFALGLSAALACGDLGAIALFADPAAATLPLAMYGLMDSYRTDAAAAAALILVCLSFGLFYLFDRVLGRGGS